jgi:mRNA interferase YafQ
MTTIYRIARSNSYKRDYRLAERQGRDVERLECVIDALASGDSLPAEYRDHPLKGEYKGYRECHIEPDWLLVYKIDKGLLVLLLSRTGAHSKIFGG